MSIEVHSSSPEQPGTLICHTEYTPILIDGDYVPGPAAITVTRADEWIQVNSEFADRLIDEGMARQDAQSLMLTVGTNEVVAYRHVRPFDQHSDLYKRVTRLPGETWALTADDYAAINPACEHGIVKGLITCPKCEPERQASAEASARAMQLPNPAFSSPGRAAPKHGPLCTINTATGQCRSPHCRVCGGVADAQGFCPTCPAESGPHADGFRLMVLKSATAVESPDRPYAAQEAAAEQKRQHPIAAEVRQLLAGVESITTEQLTEHLQREGELATRVDELQATLAEVLGHFTEKGHPGEPCLRTGWLSVKWVDRWRRIAAGRPSWDQLFALIDVKLTPWQQDVLAEAWAYRETHGMWPQVIRVGQRRPGHKTLQAAAAELLERARACGWAE